MTKQQTLDGGIHEPTLRKPRRSRIILEVTTTLDKVMGKDLGDDYDDDEDWTDSVEESFHESINEVITNIITEDDESEFTSRVLSQMDLGDLLPKKVEEFGDLGKIHITISHEYDKGEHEDGTS